MLSIFKRNNNNKTSQISCPIISHNKAETGQQMQKEGENNDAREKEALEACPSALSHEEGLEDDRRKESIYNECLISLMEGGPGLISNISDPESRERIFEFVKFDLEQEVVRLRHMREKSLPSGL